MDRSNDANMFCFFHKVNLHGVNGEEVVTLKIVFVNGERTGDEKLKFGFFWYKADLVLRTVLFGEIEKITEAAEVIGTEENIIGLANAGDDNIMERNAKT